MMRLFNQSIFVFVLTTSLCSAKTITKEIHYLDHFEFEGPGKVFISQSDHNELILDADEKVLSDTKVEIGKGHLTVIRKKKAFRPTSTEFSCKLYVKELSAISLKGDVIISTDALQIENLKITAEGANKGSMSLKGGNLLTFINGSADLKFDGSVKKQTVLLEGSGSYDAKNLQSESCEIKIEGSGNAHINANKSLAIAIIGSGEVYYSGSPEVSQNVMGSGKVVKE